MDYDDVEELTREVRQIGRLLRGVHTLLLGILLPLTFCGIAAFLFILDAVAARYGWWAWLAAMVVFAIAGWYIHAIGRDAER